MQSFGPYQVVRELGRGGMGVVYEVSHPNTTRRLALKQVLQDAASPQALTRFQREGELLARVQHPSVVRAHDGGQSPRGPFLVTDLIEGEELGDVLKRGPLPPEDAIALARKLADALEAVHRAGCLHRDLKPANVILQPDGTPVLIDFGLAREAGDGPRLTQTGALAGTPHYMAPEQADGTSSRELDARVDVYGLGGILFACLTGRPPFEGSGLAQILKRVLLDPVRWPAEPALDPALRYVVERALSKAPEERYPSAAEFSAELDRYEAGEVEPPPPPRLPWVLAGVGLLLAGALTAGAVALWPEAPPEPADPNPVAVVRSKTVAAPRRLPRQRYDWSTPTNLQLTFLRSQRFDELLGLPDKGGVNVEFLSADRVVCLSRIAGLVAVWDLASEARAGGPSYQDRAWGLKTSNDSRSPNTPPGDRPRYPYTRTLAVEPGGRRFLVAGEQHHALLYTESGAGFSRRELRPAQPATYDGPRLSFDLDAFSAAFDPRRDEVLVGLREGEVVRFDLARGVEVGRLPAESENPVTAIALSQDGRHLALIHGFPHDRGFGGKADRRPPSDPTQRATDYRLRLLERSESGWRAVRTTPPEELMSANSLEAVVFRTGHPGEVVVGTRNSSLLRFDLERKLPEVRRGGYVSHIGIMDLQLSPDGEHLFSVQSSMQSDEAPKKSEVKLWSLKSGKEISLDLPRHELHRFTAFRIGPSGRFAVLGHGRPTAVEFFEVTGLE